MIFVLGAGATYNEGLEQNVEERMRPPLDKKFFSIYKKIPDRYIYPIEDYLKKTYDVSIYKEEYNSLEKILILLYIDIFRSENAFNLYIYLIDSLCNRLADTTKNLNYNSENTFYKIIKFYMSNFNLKPDQVIFINFNYDIQIEKLIDELGKDETIKTNLLNFPYCYQLNKLATYPNEDIEWKNGKYERPSESFEISSKENKGVKILKLHGSINWHGFYRSPLRNKEILYDKDREMNVCSNKTLCPITTRDLPRGRALNSFPMIVPPVIHKSGIFHKNIDRIWKQALENLKEASQVIIFGYSFPESDLESVLLFKSALKGRNDIKFSIIDPDPSVIKRFVNITNINKINWYKSLPDFFEHIKLLKG